ncbi:MAG: tetratricopeptide repeat protein [Myxococcota bacterium]|nr:tetratricopeptide repeat protein [Myxococcota bacterium]
MVDRDAIQAERRRALNEMLAENPDDVFALYGLALEHKVDHRLDDARRLLARTIELDPNHLYAYYQLGEVLMTLGEEDDAQRIVSQGASTAEKLGDAKALAELNALLDLM